MQEKIATSNETVSLFKRYPGLPPFKKSQAALFCGRDEDINRLYDIVKNESLMILFGSSGTGKSSLLNAGLSPVLEMNGFLPLNIRLQTVTDDNSTPKKLVLDALATFKDEIPTPKRYEQRNNVSLWETLKTCKFPFYTIPVLIFDQFEELFSSSKDRQREFLHELAEIVHTQPPNDILNWLGSIPVKERTEDQVNWCSQPRLRVLIAIRSDRFFEFNQWGHVLPQVLRTCVELLPLTKEKAYLAIREPAETEKVSTPPYFRKFSYDEKALTTIVNRLSAGKSYVEPSYLQILCSEMEDKLMDPAYAGDRSKVSENDVLAQFNLTTIIESFYSNQLAKLKDQAQIETAKTLLEDKMVSNRRRRLLLEDEVLAALKPFDQPLLQKLQDLRLIRGDSREDQKLYEISHDILLGPITKAAEIRRLRDNNAKALKDTIKRQEKLRLKLEEEKKVREKEALAAAELKQAYDKAEAATKEAKKQETIAREEAANTERLYEVLKVEAKRTARIKNWSIIVSVLFLIGLITLAFVFYINRGYLKDAKTAYGNSIFYRANEQLKQGNHWQAFLLFEESDRLIGRDTLLGLLQRNIFGLLSGKKIKLSTDGKWAAVIDADKKLHLYVDSSGQFVQRSSRDSVESIELSAHNNLLIYRNTRKQNLFLTLSTGKDLMPSSSYITNLNTGSDSTNNEASRELKLSFTPDRNVAYTRKDSAIWFYSLKDNEPMHNLNLASKNLSSSYKGVLPVARFLWQKPYVIFQISRPPGKDGKFYYYIIILNAETGEVEISPKQLYTKNFIEGKQSIYFEDSLFNIIKYDFSLHKIASVMRLTDDKKLVSVINDSLFVISSGKKRLPFFLNDSISIYNRNTSKYVIRDLDSCEYFTTPRGKSYVLYSIDGKLNILDLSTGIIHNYDKASAGYSLSGTNFIQCVTGVNDVTLYDLESFSELISVHTPDNGSTDFLVDQAGNAYCLKILLTEVQVIDARSRKLMMTIPFVNYAISADFEIFKSMHSDNIFIQGADGNTEYLTLLDSIARTRDFLQTEYGKKPTAELIKYGLGKYK